MVKLNCTFCFTCEIWKSSIDFIAPWWIIVDVMDTLFCLLFIMNRSSNELHWLLSLPLLWLDLSVLSVVKEWILCPCSIVRHLNWFSLWEMPPSLTSLSTLSNPRICFHCSEFSEFFLAMSWECVSFSRRVEWVFICFYIMDNELSFLPFHSPVGFAQCLNNSPWGTDLWFRLPCCTLLLMFQCLSVLLIFSHTHKHMYTLSATACFSHLRCKPGRLGVHELPERHSCLLKTMLASFLTLVTFRPRYCLTALYSGNWNICGAMELWKWVMWLYTQPWSQVKSHFSQQAQSCTQSA